MMRIIGGPRPSEVGCGILKDQICEAPRISQNNRWVMLHWARMALCRGYQEARSNSNRSSPTESTLPAEKQIEQ
jgi:hypothetical protein